MKTTNLPPALAAVKKRKKVSRGRERKSKSKTKSRAAKAKTRKVVRKRGAKAVKKRSMAGGTKRRKLGIRPKSRKARKKKAVARKRVRKPSKLPSKRKRVPAKKPARKRPAKGRARKPAKKPGRAKPTRRVPKRPTPRRKKAKPKSQKEKVLAKPARGPRSLVEVHGARGSRVMGGLRELASGVYFVESGSIYGYQEGEPTEGDRVMVSGHASRWYRDYAKAFEMAFEPRLKMTRFTDPDDAPFFRFGILVRSRPGRVSSKRELSRLLEDLAAWISERLPRDWAAHLVEEGRGYSVRINMGNYEQETQFTDAIGELKGHKRLLDDILDKISGYHGGDDPLWFPFWEWEEFEGGS
jgi:hypothetical protein